MEYDGTFAMDKMAVRMMEENQIPGLLAFRNVKTAEESYFRYDCKNGYSLADWLLEVHTKSEVLHMIESILLVGDEVEAYLMDKKCVCTQPEDIMVENHKAFMAYIPDASNECGNILSMIQSILPKVKFARDEDFTYIFDLMNAFSRNEITKVLELKKWLKVFQNGAEASKAHTREEASEPAWTGFSSGFSNEPSVNPEPVKEDVVIEEVKKRGFLPGKSKSSDKEVKNDKFEIPSFDKAPVKEKPAASSAGGSDLFDDFFGGSVPASAKSEPKKKVEKEKKVSKADVKPEKKNVLAGLSFGSKKKENLDIGIQTPEVPERKEISDLGYINEPGYLDKTVMLSDGESAYLIRNRNQEEYSVGQSRNSIGRSVDANICITGNKAIARIQASIYEENGTYYIMDEGSSNGTCVDGIRLHARQPYPLNNYSRVQFADESFTFEIRS